MADDDEGVKGTEEEEEEDAWQRTRVNCLLLRGDDDTGESVDRQFEETNEVSSPCWGWLVIKG